MPSKITSEELRRLQIECLEVIVSQGLKGGYSASIISESKQDLERLRGIEMDAVIKKEANDVEVKMEDDDVKVKMEYDDVKFKMEDITVRFGDRKSNVKVEDEDSAEMLSKVKDRSGMNVSTSSLTRAPALNPNPFSIEREEEKISDEQDYDSDFDSLFDEEDKNEKVIVQQSSSQYPNSLDRRPHSVSSDLKRAEEHSFLYHHFRGKPVPRNAVWEYPGIIFFKCQNPDTRRWSNSRMIDSDYLSDAPQFGEIPGFPVGWWWCSRFTLHRDAVHRSIQGGIAGSIDDGGATSILLNGGYTEDRDNGGNVFLYTGSGGRNATNKRHVRHQEMSGRNRALRISWQRGMPIRVIRGKDGICYDGLYKIIREPWEKIGDSGFKVFMFEFERCPRQAPIDTSGWVARKNDLYRNPDGYPRPVFPRE
ncbi:E3 ubiquitin-protein ligase UHRF1 [Neolecta irregularis DAH-3]|uniref:E3 ubiquitin-protein ligase UHRF1 n=1 Tax=Neolecta irregularis (strain DAH-3) TaxID=1198029 RepID=A0A1U7LSS6_NEOID|nr:E3 ubiquitin-protein ligase UHRF1 [Neolecta irregularis DAH-3]|eukprot:OLL25679.1 E3 ubiquitin-protein ligase UHRF1 [Neolecta irregularis DAH-3]